MFDREIDYHKEFAGWNTAIRQIEARMQLIIASADYKINKTAKEWKHEQAARDGGKNLENTRFL